MQDTDPTVLFSSEDPVFRALLCTGSPVTWGSMQIWVMTAAGEGQRFNIVGTVQTPSC